MCVCVRVCACVHVCVRAFICVEKPMTPVKCMRVCLCIAYLPPLPLKGPHHKVVFPTLVKRLLSDGSLHHTQPWVCYRPFGL